jgi:Collagen triple helix repeat (20 copies)
MFSWISRRATYANVVATMALVFAMSGGALAAGRYLITSTKQIKPSVVASLKGVKGPAGAQGLAGAAGPQGPAGAAGAKGETGAAGKEGAQGIQGPAGPAGAKGAAGVAGPEGSPWTAGGTLPAGASETGFWSASTNLGGAGVYPLGSISFPIPLAAPSTTVEYLTKAQTESSIGSGKCEYAPESLTSKPVAPPHTLCVFTSDETIGEEWYVGVSGAEGEGDSPGGANVWVKTTADGRAMLAGAWAVTN